MTEITCKRCHAQGGVRADARAVGPRAALSTLDQGWFETPMTDPARAFLQYWTMLTS